jgi:hypothetical protein
MIAEGWNRYRAWAKRARTLQAASERDKLLALVAAVLAALFGAIAATVPTTDATAPTTWATLATIAAVLAATAAAATAILGRDVLEVGHEKKWILARATAEAMKSECFVAAARAAPYDGADAAARFAARLDEIERNALDERVVPLPDPAQDDRRRPAETMDLPWYRSERMVEQQKYYADRQQEHEAATRNLRFAGLGMALLGALLGAIAAAGFTGFAPWIGLTTSVAAAVGAWGYMARRSILAATYGTMAHRLGTLSDRAVHTQRALPEIVTETENLLRAEHSEWLLQMQQGPEGAAAEGGKAAPSGQAG